MRVELIKENLNNYWRNLDRSILLSFILLFFLGLFFSFASTSSLAGERLDKDYYFFFYKHLAFALLAILITFTISLVEIKLFKKIEISIFIFLLILLFLVPFFGIEVKGSKRWLDFYYFRLQPIELIKPFFVLVSARILTLDKYKTSVKHYALSFLLLTTIIILLINQPDFGQTVLLIGTWTSIVFISGISLFYIFLLFFSFLFSLISIILLVPEKFSYITTRILNFLDPSTGDSFQSQKALDAIKLGGLTGQGMGEGILKDSVPEAHTDYVISVISEEFGSIISILLILIFFYIVFKIVKKTVTENNKYIKISLCGLSSLLIFQTFIHIGVNTSLLPTTGMTLPFLSYGGSSLIGSAILAGVILNYTKRRFDDES